MSDKMKRFLNKKVIHKPIQRIVENHTTDCIKTYNNILNESVSILPIDKENIYHYIEQPANRSIVLQSYGDEYDVADRTITISRKSGIMTQIVYNAELVEITDFLITLCDEMGYRFQTNDQVSPNITSFIIYVK